MDWEFVKHRTATADGTVWRSADGSLFRRTGGEEIAAEANCQRELAELGYPVPEIIDAGVDGNGRNFFIERSAGDYSMHDQALADMDAYGHVSDETFTAIAEVSVGLLAAQARQAEPATEDELRTWFDAASFASNVFEENPDLDTDRTHQLIDKMLERLTSVPMCLGHLDYGLPNAYRGGVIDWQHHAYAPLGYDVYPALDIAAFNGGNKGYPFSQQQRNNYWAALNDTSTQIVGRSLSKYLGDFVLVKCFFFLAFMKPPADGSRLDKQAKWEYRRALFCDGLSQYDATGTIDTAEFPTRGSFDAGRG